LTRRSVPDIHLFEAAMRDVVPLRKTKKPKSVPKPAVPTPRIVEVPVLFSMPLPKTPIRSAALPGLDRNTARKFERGELPIDRAIDLHGLTQQRAHEALDRFMGEAVKAGLRMLLVVTGKGKQGEGVLRRQVPEWLRGGPYASRILRLANARLPHGGDGALYVLLRRNR
jgi:DNA-nicking Smr family endonuclease